MKPKKPTDCRRVTLPNGNAVKAGRIKGGFAFACTNVQGNACVVTHFSLSVGAAYALAAIILAYSHDEAKTEIAAADGPKTKKRERAR